MRCWQYILPRCTSEQSFLTRISRAFLSSLWKADLLTSSSRLLGTQSDLHEKNRLPWLKLIIWGIFSLFCCYIQLNLILIEPLSTLSRVEILLWKVRSCDRLTLQPDTLTRNKHGLHASCRFTDTVPKAYSPSGWHGFHSMNPLCCFHLPWPPFWLCITAYSPHLQLVWVQLDHFLILLWPSYTCHWKQITHFMLVRQLLLF